MITYTRSQSQTDHKTVERVSGRGKDTRDWEMKHDYKATVGVVEAPEKNGLSTGKASITSAFMSKETGIAVEKNSCDRGKTWQDMTGTFTTETHIDCQGKTEANVNIGINSDGTYTVSVGLPQIAGTLTGSESSSFSGQCKPKEGKNRSLPPTPTTVQGQSLTSDGSNRIDPTNPNQLSGSYSLPLPGGVVETITWSLQKNAAPLRIVDLKFEDMKFPNWNDWQEITEQVGTVDGNLVKIKATVLNGSSETKTAELYFKETYKGDKWDGAKPDAPLQDQTFTMTLEAGEAREVEMVWNSSGYSWYDDGRPRYVQRIKAELRESSKKVDELTRHLKVAPKPIVMVPGIWTNPVDFEIYQNLLTTTHSYDWKTYMVVDVSAQGTIASETTVKPMTTRSSVYERADNLTAYVKNVRSERNAWHIDLLSHGTGGLVARLYVHKQMDVLPDGQPVVKHLMMMGTPNNGESCDEILARLSAREEYQQAAKELAPEEIALFNKYVVQRKGTLFSALAGNQVPVPCEPPEWSDGWVPVSSATHGIEDVTICDALHSDLLSVKNFTTYVKPHVVTGPRGTYPFAKSNAN